MSRPKLTPQEYEGALVMSGKKHILVEGKDDKRGLTLLLDQFDEINNTHLNDEINIDTADELVRGEGHSLANWQKVEKVCQLVADKSYSNRFVGFVDRMFREFELNDPLTDHLNGHKVSGPLVWSRGHSFENYLFDAAVLRESFRSISDFENFVDTVNRFTDIFEPAIRLSCVISLAAKQVKKLELVRATFDWPLIELSSSDVTLNLNDWRIKLIKQKRLEMREADLLLHRIAYWRPIVGKTDFEIVRWLTDGHLGFNLIWAVYGRCVFDILSIENKTDAKKRTRHFFRLGKGIITQLSSSNWARRALDNQCEYPKPILKRLGLMSS